MLSKRLIYSWLLLMFSTSIIVVAGGLYFSTSAVQAEPPKKAPAKALHSLKVPVYLSKAKRVQQVPLEQYVLGVVAAEMPDRFAAEALKAQAIAARTYIVHKLMENNRSNKPKPFFILDTTLDQVYLEAAEIERKWRKANDRQGLLKLRAAVQATAGMIITYKKKPIDATYFSTSNGYTENANDYWGERIPYLQSVASPWDRAISNRYQTNVNMSYPAFLQKLGIRSGNAQQTAREMRIIARTAGNRIKTIQIGKHKLTGRQFRERLNLRSAHVIWKLEPHQIVITTFGYGHGVGMSQWGAQGMASKGYKAKQILRHYYQGVSIQPLRDIWPSTK